MSKHTTGVIAATHLKIGRQSWAVTDLAHASVVYQQQRDASGKGSSGFPAGAVYRGERRLATVTYNGRVWSADGNRTLLVEAQ
jgi:hypothetical protein